MMKGKNQRGQRKAIKQKSKMNRISYTTSGVSKLPRSPGVYTINHSGEKYIGSTKDLRGRIGQHMRNGREGTTVSFRRTVTRKQAYDIERKSIRRTCPSQNKTKPDICKNFWEKNFGFRL